MSGANSSNLRFVSRIKTTSGLFVRTKSSMSTKEASLKPSTFSRDVFSVVFELTTPMFSLRLYLYTFLNL